MEGRAARGVPAADDHGDVDEPPLPPPSGVPLSEPLGDAPVDRDREDASIEVDEDEDEEPEVRDREVAAEEASSSGVGLKAAKDFDQDDFLQPPSTPGGEKQTRLLHISWRSMTQTTTPLETLMFCTLYSSGVRSEL